LRRVPFSPTAIPRLSPPKATASIEATDTDWLMTVHVTPASSVLQISP